MGTTGKHGVGVGLAGGAAGAVGTAPGVAVGAVPARDPEDGVVLDEVGPGPVALPDGPASAVVGADDAGASWAGGVVWAPRLEVRFSPAAVTAITT